MLLYKFCVFPGFEMKQDFSIRLWHIPMLPAPSRFLIYICTCHQSGMLQSFRLRSAIYVDFTTFFLACLFNATHVQTHTRFNRVWCLS